MRVPCCSLCNVRYDEEERTPLLLHCGHGFCRACLSRMLAAAPGATLPCPRCRHLTAVGNSVSALRKNFPILSLLSASPSSPSFLHSDSGSSSDGSDDEDDFFKRSRRPASAPAAAPPGCSSFDLASHPDLKLARRIGSGPPGPAGQEVWAGTLSRGGGAKRCKHQVAVKRVPLAAGDGLEGVQEVVERLRRASTWCRNVCTFHGAVRVGSHLCFVMDRYVGSVQAEMRQNGGRLTLEQILRYGADIARGVAELHAAGIVCMSIKPSNILLDANGHAVVSDYGLSAILKNLTSRRVPDDSSAGIDATLLSPNYTAPEAWGPLKKSLNMFWDSANGISPESDAWSFGCTLVEMCTGAVPWAGLSAEEICKSVVKEKKPPPQYSRVVGVGLPGELWKMIGDCLQFRASRRPSFQDMLKTFLRHLLDIPRSPPASPENDFTNESLPNGMEPPTTSILEMAHDNPNALHHLVCEGDADGVRDLLAKAASEGNDSLIRSLLEAQNSDGHTALHLACRRGSAELVEAIVAYQENVDILDKDEDPPIVFALAAGSPRCVRALVGRSASINSRLREGLGPTLAHVCAHHGQPECMQELLVAGADPNAIDGEGESVLHIAVARRYTDCAIVILENGGCRSMGIPNSQHRTPLHLCIETWNTAVVQRWVEVASVEEIAEAIDVPSPVGTALCMAAALKKEHEKEGRELVRILLAAGADPTAQDDPHCRTALHTAAMIDDVELVKIILEAGVDVNIRNAQNTTPLHVALNRGANSCVGLLLAAGANCNIQDDDGDNAFHIAADAAKMIRENLTWVVQMLQQPSPAVDVRNHRYEVADWVKFRRTVTSPAFGWQGAGPRSIGFVQSIVDNDHLVVSFCTGEARVLTSEVIKVIPLNRGQHVQLKPDVSEPRFGWRGQSRDSIGTVLCVDDDGILRVGFPGASRGWRADPAEIERVEEYKVGNWVRIRPSLTVAVHGMESITPGSVGIVYSIRPDSSLLLGLCYLSNPWLCEPEEVEHVDPFKFDVLDYAKNFQIGDQVCVKRSVAEPRYAWGGETHHSVGKIIDIESDGLLIIDIPNRAAQWQADPSDMEKIENFKVHVSPSISEPRLGWLNETAATIGAISRIDMDGTLNIKVSGRKSLWKVAPGDAERLSAFEVGDWVRQKPIIGSRPTYDWNSVGRISIAVVHSIQDSGYLELAGCFRNGKWLTHNTDIEKIQPFKIGQHVRFRAGIPEPRWGWRGANPDSRGIIAGVHADGEVRVAFFGVPGFWRGDPADLEIEEIIEVGEWVRLRNDADQWKSLRPGSIGVVHGVGYQGDVWDGTIHVAFCGEQERWIGPSSQLEGVSKFVVGQRVRIRGCIRQPRFGWSNHSHSSIGTISSIDADGKLRIHTPAGARAWLIDPAEVEKVEEEEEVCVGDWVKVKDSIATPTYQWGDVNHNSIGVVHRADDGELWIAFCFCERLWLCKAWEVEKVRPFRQSDRVRIRPGLVSPRWGWGMETYASKGEVVGVDANGKLRIKFRWRDRLWIGDPADIVLDDAPSLTEAPNGFF
ncbi:E3 ubiquitin-protein ligase KEG [Dichanthelium oligosanthes]|uniref:RING-type E3 ubiquitin transferase n=1 Tax=Dichanthelium oligosanthes TaxID=888268 RepID=A0A1E5UJ05_9POAL|nr:E3 ubiquitin-protein ligase KEG [Dichanthelium oligosanthes]